jgi:hypothetical protein
MHLYLRIPFIFQQEVSLAFYLPFGCLACDMFDVVAWHLLLLFFSGVFLFPPHGGLVEHKEIKECLWQFLFGD